MASINEAILLGVKMGQNDCETCWKEPCAGRSRLCAECRKKNRAEKQLTAQRKRRARTRKNNPTDTELVGKVEARLHAFTAALEREHDLTQGSSFKKVEYEPSSVYARGRQLEDSLSQLVNHLNEVLKLI